MPKDYAQVTIYNTRRTTSGKLVSAVLSIKASALKGYIMALIAEANRTFTPNRSEEFASYPLLALVDVETQETKIYDELDLPSESVYSLSGNPMLIILPEDSSLTYGINKFKKAKELSTGDKPE